MPFGADGTDPTVENGKLTIDVFAADGDDDVAALAHVKSPSLAMCWRNRHQTVNLCVR